MAARSQLASYAGVTTKAARHYQQHGLLEEPQRDASVRRRYNAQHARKTRWMHTDGIDGIEDGSIEAVDTERPSEIVKGSPQIVNGLAK